MTDMPYASQYFFKRENPFELLEKAGNRARDLDRSEVHETTSNITQTQDTDMIFLTTTYHPHDKGLKDLIYHNWEILSKSQATKRL